MNDAIRLMLDRYSCQTVDDYVNALREILQDVALLGLWRSKFFEHAAFYGGTALRVLYGLDRFSEDLDFSLLRPDPGFKLENYSSALQTELRSYGFEVRYETEEQRTGAAQAKDKSAIESAFLKTNTLKHLLEIEVEEVLARRMHPEKLLKIKLEVDTDPPGGFSTGTEYIMQPIPFPVRAYVLADLFAGKMHAVLCRKWESRIKGRDWYDMTWYIANHPQLNLRHLESRMRYSGDYDLTEPFDRGYLMSTLRREIRELDVEQAKTEVMRFLRNKASVEAWSRDFFLKIIERIEPT